jgi:hypothetical protein
LRHHVGDAGHHLDALDRSTKGFQSLLELPIQLRNRRFDLFDQREMQPQEPAVMRRWAAVKRLDQT